MFIYPGSAHMNEHAVMQAKIYCRKNVGAMYYKYKHCATGW